MQNQKNVKAMSLTVTEGLTVAVIPDSNHEFLMTTAEVANGYGVSKYVVRMASGRHSDELIEGKHFIKGGNKMLHPYNAQPHQVFWTKRGIVRLGFFIKSERAKLFRDWAEELIIKIDELQQTIPGFEPVKALPEKRKHNRLTQERMVSILADVCKIEDKELRLSITEKLMGGR